MLSWLEVGSVDIDEEDDNDDIDGGEDHDDDDDEVGSHPEENRELEQ